MNLDASTYDYPTIARHHEPRTYHRKPYDPSGTVKRMRAILDEHGQARMMLLNGKPVASRIDSHTGGRLIARYDRSATDEMIAEDAADAYGWIA